MGDVGPLSQRIRGQLAQPPGKVRADLLIAELAARQHAIVAAWQLHDLGITRAMIESRLAAGRLHKVHRGVYSVGHPPLTPEAHWMAAVLACGPGAVLSHRSAAALWRIRESAAARIDVTAPTRAGRTRDGLVVHRAGSLTEADVTTCRGIGCTTLARTILDLAEVAPMAAVEYAIHRAQARRPPLDLGALEEVLARSPGRRGVPVVRSILGRPGTLSDADAKLALERRFRKICRDAGMPTPQSNVWIALDIPAGGLEADFCWPAQRLVVDTDSRTFHQTARAFDNDPQRDRALTLAGWRVVRFRWRDVFERPGLVVAELRALLALC